MSVLVPIVLVLLALLGAPLFTIIAASALWGYFQSEIPLLVIATEIYRVAEMPILLAIPLFTFAGYILSESGAPGRLVRLTNSLLGWLPGSLAIVALTACALFTAFTGASGVTIIALRITRGASFTAELGTNVSEGGPTNGVSRQQPSASARRGALLVVLRALRS